jgi:uncharacterized protein (TIGR03437 family)
LTLPVTVRIFGFPAVVLYAGPAPTLNSGVFQLNLPAPLTVLPGIDAVLLTVAGFASSTSSSGQSGLAAIAVK